MVFFIDQTLSRLRFMIGLKDPCSSPQQKGEQ